MKIKLLRLVSGEEIIAEIELLDAQAAEALQAIKELL